MEVMALIPARGGSKTIPKKNIVEICGHPLIAFSIASGLASEVVNRVIVSTDDPKIAEIAKRYGAEVPFMRPVELAQDDTLDFPVFEHAVNWLEREENYCPDVVVQLRPTSPLRPKGLIDSSVRIFIEHPGTDCVRGVVESEESPFKTWFINDDGSMRPVMEGWFNEAYNMPRQKLPTTFWQIGHIDVIGIGTIRQKKSLTGTKILPVFIDRKYCADIDNFYHLDKTQQLVISRGLDIDWPRNESFASSDGRIV